MQRILRRISTEAKPVDPAYFTGNSKYYGFLIQANNLVRSHNLDFAQAPLAEQQRWRSKHSMIHDLELRLSDQSYQDFIQKLNLLYPIQDEKVKQFLEQFVPMGRSLDRAPPKVLSLDEFGRSFTVASRKTAKAQVWMIQGQGQVYINGRNVQEYFSEMIDRENVIKPFEIAKSLCKYNVWATVSGGGTTGQSEALAVAIGRGIIVHDPPTREALEEVGLTKIDRRQVEKKKTGQPKARKKNTWVKR